MKSWTCQQGHQMFHCCFQHHAVWVGKFDHSWALKKFCLLNTRLKFQRFLCKYVKYAKIVSNSASVKFPYWMFEKEILWIISILTFNIHVSLLTSLSKMRISLEKRLHSSSMSSTLISLQEVVLHAVMVDSTMVIMSHSSFKRTTSCLENETEHKVD